MRRLAFFLLLSLGFHLGLLALPGFRGGGGEATATASATARISALVGTQREGSDTSSTDSPPASPIPDRQKNSEGLRPALPRFAPPSPPAPRGGAESAASAAIAVADLFESPFAPGFPLPLLAQGIRGSVTVQFEVGSSGVPEKVAVIDSNPPGAFDGAVLAALHRTRMRVPEQERRTVYTLQISFDPSSTVGSLGKPAAP